MNARRGRPRLEPTLDEIVHDITRRLDVEGAGTRIRRDEWRIITDALATLAAHVLVARDARQARR
jgi:hypothetical protein